MRGGKQLHVYKKRETICEFVSTKRKTSLLVFVEHDRVNDLKANGFITLKQFKIWLRRETSAFPSSRNQKARIARLNKIYMQTTMAKDKHKGSA